MDKKEPLSAYSGKVILTGEFGAILGCQTIIFPTNHLMRAFFSTCPSSISVFRLNDTPIPTTFFDVSDLGSELDWDSVFEETRQIIEASAFPVFDYVYSYFFKSNPKLFPPSGTQVDLIVESDIPQKSGLGSSAAFTLVLIDFFEV